MQRNGREACLCGVLRGKRGDAIGWRCAGLCCHRGIRALFFRHAAPSAVPPGIIQYAFLSRRHAFGASRPHRGGIFWWAACRFNRGTSRGGCLLVTSA
jgi:hypothetical protein